MLARSRASSRRDRNERRARSCGGGGRRAAAQRRRRTTTWKRRRTRRLRFGDDLEQLGEVAKRLPLVEALAPDERVPIDRAQCRLLADRREPDRPDGNAGDTDVPVLAR